MASLEFTGDRARLGFRERELQLRWFGLKLASQTIAIQT